MNATRFDLVGKYGINQGENWALQVNVKSTAWLITVGGAPGGGAWSPGWSTSLPQARVRVPYNGTAAIVQAAFQALESVGAAGVKNCTGGSGGPWTLALADELVATSGNPAPVVDDSLLLPYGGSVSVVPAPYNLTGYTGKMQIRPAAGGTVYAELSTANAGVAISGAAGVISLSIPPSVTALFGRWTAAVYDLYVTAPGVAPTCAMYGTVENRPEVTALP